MLLFFGYWGLMPCGALNFFFLDRYVGLEIEVDRTSGLGNAGLLIRLVLLWPGARMARYRHPLR